MELNKLHGFVYLLIFLGMLLGVGVLTLDKYSRAVRTTTTSIDIENNLSATGTVDFTETFCLSVTSIGNQSVDFVLTDYNVTFTDEDACVMSYDGFGAACRDTLDLCNVTFTYGIATEASGVADDVNSAITPISSTWLPLIVTVFVLALILGLVIDSFGQKRR